MAEPSVIPEGSGRSRAGRRWTWTLVLVCLALGGWLRFHDLGRQSLWQDEIHTVQYVNDHPSVWTVIHRVATWDLHSPLYYVLLRLQVWLQQAAQIPLNDANLRILSAILGSLGFLAVGLLFHQVFRRASFVLAGLALAAFNTYGIYYSQEIRMYALVLLLAPLVLYFHARLWEGPEGRLARGPAWGYILCSVALLYSSLIGLFFVFGVWLSELLLNLPLGANPRRRWLTILGLGAVILVCYLPWLGVMWRQSQELKGGVATGLVINSPRELFKFAFEKLLFHDWKMGTGYDLWNRAFRLLLPLALFNLWDREHGKAHGRILLALGCSFLVYLLLTLNRPFHTGRYFSTWWPFAIYLLVAVFTGLRQLLARIWKPGQGIALGLGLVAAGGYLWLQVPQLRHYFTDFKKEEWREMTRFLNEHRRADEVLLVTGDWERQTLAYYGVQLPFIPGGELVSGKLPPHYKRFLYIGPQDPRKEVPGLTQDFKQQAWPFSTKEMFLWERP